jgi:hypothetical protein
VWSFVVWSGNWKQFNIFHLEHCLKKDGLCGFSFDKMRQRQESFKTVLRTQTIREPCHIFENEFKLICGLFVLAHILVIVKYFSRNILNTKGYCSKVVSKIDWLNQIWYTSPTNRHNMNKEEINIVWTFTALVKRKKTRKEKANKNRIKLS